MIWLKFLLLLRQKKFMGKNDNIICCYNLINNKYELFYFDGIRLTFIDKHDNRSQAKFALYVLSNSN